MDTEAKKPKRRWWRKKRWWAALAACLVVTYPLSFVLAGWTLTWFGPRPASTEWAVIRRLYRPVAALLIASPPPVRTAASRAVEFGSPDGVEFRINPVMVLIVWPGDDPDSKTMAQVW